MVLHQQKVFVHILDQNFHQYNSYSRRNSKLLGRGSCRNNNKCNQEPYQLYNSGNMQQYFLYYHHIEIEGMACQGDDNEDLYMENDTDKDNRQPTKNQNKHLHFDKVVKHIE